VLVLVNHLFLRQIGLSESVAHHGPILHMPLLDEIMGKIQRRQGCIFTRSVTSWNPWAAIYPIIGHVKPDNRMDRDHLEEEDVERMNAILARCSFDKMEPMRSFFYFGFGLLFFDRFDEDDVYPGRFMASVAA